MKRCLVMIPDQQQRGCFVNDRGRMEELARRIEGMHPDTVIELVEPEAVVVQVVDELVDVIRHSLGCAVHEVHPDFLRTNNTPPAPPRPEGIPNWDVYERSLPRMSDEAFDDMIEDFNRGEGDD